MSALALINMGCEARPPAPTSPPPEAVPPPATAPAAITAPAPPGAVGAPEVVQYADDPVRRAYVYRPSGAGPFPAIVYNHGSEETPSDFRGQARFFVPRGYLLLVPHRRGHGLSSVAWPYARDVLTRGAVEPAPGALVAVLDQQLDDVLAAVGYARALPDVDPARVSVIGCSLGGVETLLAAERGDGIRAAVDFAGGSMTWARDGALRERMTEAARGAKVPVLFIQAENDFDTTPSTTLAAAMQGLGLPARAEIFPAAGTTAHEGHAFCAGGTSPAWGDAVLAFITAPPSR
ncbi:MAG: dienelactone hydrolase family protein [Deltaproteobacteria bacterium]|nr:dienelactone hydrolase family protein [Deltaproteobacteria bacterium]